MDTFPNDMPEVIFYDNACKLLAHIFQSPEDRERFVGSIVAVDAFHFRSHASSDCFCREWTDPHIYPELKMNNKWVYNSSAAEITNIWYGGFASICRAMHSIQFQYFLNEMVRLRNIWLCKKLAKKDSIGHVGTVNLGR